MNLNGPNPDPSLPEEEPATADEWLVALLYGVILCGSITGVVWFIIERTS